jgi:hypothetical protein
VARKQRGSELTCVLAGTRNNSEYQQTWRRLSEHDEQSNTRCSEQCEGRNVRYG